MVDRLGDWKVVMRELVVDSKRARRIRGVSGADVVEDSVCTITRSRSTVKT
jgi:hypothetical protein